MGRRKRVNVFREGKVHVCAALCPSCIYRPGSPLMEVPIKAAAVRDQTAVICHSTIDLKEQAVCRGFYETTPTLPLMLARDLDLIVFDKLDKEN